MDSHESVVQPSGGPHEARLDKIERALVKIDARLQRVTFLLESQTRPISKMENHVHMVERILFPIKGLLRLK
tara:strand:- start:1641 stop:1856 length:216 start_codon:yes stop_codon:yes gene_type:complete